MGSPRAARRARCPLCRVPSRQPPAPRFRPAHDHAGGSVQAGHGIDYQLEALWHRRLLSHRIHKHSHLHAKGGAAGNRSRRRGPFEGTGPVACYSILTDAHLQAQAAAGRRVHTQREGRHRAMLCSAPTLHHGGMPSHGSDPPRAAPTHLCLFKVWLAGKVEQQVEVCQPRPVRLAAACCKVGLELGCACAKGRQHPVGGWEGWGARRACGAVLPGGT